MAYRLGCGFVSLETLQQTFDSVFVIGKKLCFRWECWRGARFTWFPCSNTGYQHDWGFHCCDGCDTAERDQVLTVCILWHVCLAVHLSCQLGTLSMMCLPSAYCTQWLWRALHMLVLFGSWYPSGALHASFTHWCVWCLSPINVCVAFICLMVVRRVAPWLLQCIVFNWLCAMHDVCWL